MTVAVDIGHFVFVVIRVAALIFDNGQKNIQRAKKCFLEPVPFKHFDRYIHTHTYLSDAASKVI